jgi:hypothetical protein
MTKASARWMRLTSASSARSLGAVTASIRRRFSTVDMELVRRFLSADAGLYDATRSANEVNDDAHSWTPGSRARSKTSARILAP